MKKLLFYILCLCFGASSLGFFALLPLDLGGAKIYLFDLVSGVYVLLGLFLILNSKIKLYIPKYFILMGLFMGIAVISLILNSWQYSLPQLINSSFYIVRLSIYYLLSLVTFNVFNKDLLFKERIVKVMLGSVLFLSVAGFIQLLLVPDFTVLPKEQGWDPHLNRLASTFFDPNFAGGYIVLGLIMIFSILSSTDISTKTKSILLGVSGVLITALVATFSRSSWLMFSVVVLIFGLFRTRKLLFLTILLMFLTYYLVPRAQTRLSGVTDPSDSAALRITSWKNALSIAQDNPVAGVGFNAYRYAQAEYGYFDYKDETGGNAGAGADSSLLLVLATTGVPGLVVFISQFVVIFWNGMTGWFKSNNYLAAGLAISVVSLVVHSQFVNSIFYPQFLLWMSVLSALSFFEVDFDR